MASEGGYLIVTIIFGIFLFVVCCFCAMRFGLYFHQKTMPRKNKKVDLDEIIARHKKKRRPQLKKKGSSKGKKKKKKRGEGDGIEVGGLSPNPTYGSLREEEEEEKGLMEDHRHQQHEYQEYHQNIPSYQKREEESGESQGEDMNTPDDMLLQSFKTILEGGVELLSHTGDGKPKKVQVLLLGGEIVVKGSSFLFKKSESIPLMDVKHVEGGKKTPAFNTPAGHEVPEGLCFSLVADYRTWDFETTTKVTLIINFS